MREEVEKKTGRKDIVEDDGNESKIKNNSNRKQGRKIIFFKFPRIKIISLTFKLHKDVNFHLPEA